MKQGVGVLVVLSTLVAAGARAQGPTPVSPGSQAGMAVVSGRCPTFNWTAAAGAEPVELVVYRVPEGETEGPPEQVLSVSLPGTANGWSPSLAQCLKPGGRYAWSVRAGGEWSEASLFEVSLAPSDAEVQAAIAVLRRIEGSGGPSEVAGTEQPPPTAPSTALSRTAAALVSPSVGIGSPEPATITPPGYYDLSIAGDVDLGGIVFANGQAFLHGQGTSNTALGRQAMVYLQSDGFYGSENTAIGARALSATTTGRSNVAVGSGALTYNATGRANTAVGYHALFFNVDGSHNIAIGYFALANAQSTNNTAVGAYTLLADTSNDNAAFGAHALRKNLQARNTGLGSEALRNNTTGHDNTAVGHAALRDNLSGKQNTAIGQAALLENELGNDNTAVGEDALRYSTGSRNIAVGRYAGRAATTGNDNIFIGNTGAAAETATIKIGIHNTQSQTFIAGISNSTVTDAGVLIDTSNGRLGVNTSSRRFKEGIREIGDRSLALLDLRPVAFHHKGGSTEAPQPLEFGLIAEEVADVFPELVVYDETEQPFTVKYHLLSSLLLNELQKQNRQNQVQWALMGVMFLATVALTVGRWRFE
ncbi:MAG: hypothetical protein GY769_02765 [bacterium]|nr:hypothetical protein [bacterium]